MRLAEIAPGLPSQEIASLDLWSTAARPEPNSGPDAFMLAVQERTARRGTVAASPASSPMLMSLAPGSMFAVECESFQFQDLVAVVCRIDTRQHRLRLFHTDEKGRPLKNFTSVNRLLKPRDEKLVFAMNAGMYHRDFSAVGLLVIDGKQVQPLTLDNGAGNFFLKPNGVFLVSDQGARVVESSRYPALNENVEIATQSGPMLVLDGALHPAFRKNGTSRQIRNGVGILSEHEVVFAISEEPVTFYEFAELFRNGLGCKDALFLDASVSSLYTENLDRADLRASLGPIIGVTRASE